MLLVSEDADVTLTSQSIVASITEGRGLGSLEASDVSCSVLQVDVQDRGATRLSSGEDPLLGSRQPPSC